jgi:hypothetical protein
MPKVEKPADPMEWWEQWYDSVPNVWKKGMDGDKETL